jgi:hypothetical protein
MKASLSITASFQLMHRRKKFSVLSEEVGGVHGWLFADWLWRFRGWLDRLLGGPGMRGRSQALKVGDVVDFYRVEAFEDGRLLRLRSELKAPGEGWMEWRVEGVGDRTRLSQTGFFSPRSLSGFAYWYLLGPIHKLVFRGLIRSIVQKSKKV